MSTLFVMEAVSLFCGDEDPTAGKHLSIQELKLPDMNETFADHTPGGGRVGIEVPVGIEKFEAPFKLTGFDPQVMSQFGLHTKVAQNYTAYGSVINRRTGAAIEAKALMEGRLGKVSPEAFKKGDLHGFDYAINGITHYELHFDGVEKFYFDFFTNAWRVDGVDQNADQNRILRIG
jgi:P2 family phage contractile tail tube protein